MICRSERGVWMMIRISTESLLHQKRPKVRAKMLNRLPRGRSEHRPQKPSRDSRERDFQPAMVPNGLVTFIHKIGTAKSVHRSQSPQAHGSIRPYVRNIVEQVATDDW